MTTAEVAMPFKHLQALLSEVKLAINNDDHKALYKTIASVSEGVSDVKTSTDVFIQPRNNNPTKLLR